MDDHHIKVDLLKLLDDNRLTVAQGTSNRNNVLFVVGKSSAVTKLEELTSCYTDRANMKIATVEDIGLGKGQNHGLRYTYLILNCGREHSKEIRETNPNC